MLCSTLYPRNLDVQWCAGYLFGRSGAVHTPQLLIGRYGSKLSVPMVVELLGPQWPKEVIIFSEALRYLFANPPAKVL